MCFLFQFPPKMTYLEANLILFYKKHNPTKVDHVPLFLKKYRGREAEMVEMLERKYNDWFPQI